MRILIITTALAFSGHVNAGLFTKSVDDFINNKALFDVYSATCEKEKKNNSLSETCTNYYLAKDKGLASGSPADFTEINANIGKNTFFKKPLRNVSDIAILIYNQSKEQCDIELPLKKVKRMQIVTDLKVLLDDKGADAVRNKTDSIDCEQIKLQNELVANR